MKYILQFYMVTVNKKLKTLTINLVYYTIKNNYKPQGMIMIQKLFFDSLPSTNTFAKENIASLSLPTLITANDKHCTFITANINYRE